MKPQPEPDLPECLPTVERLQAALDTGELRAVESDPHARVCATCRGRIRAARALLAALATPTNVGLPPSFADRVLADARPASPSRPWRVVAVVVGIAAAVLIAVWAIGRQPAPEGGIPEVVEVTPLPTAPPPKPLRIDDGLARAGQALRDTARPLTEPTTPKLFASLSNPFTKSANPVDLEPARKSLSDMPEAAMIGFEPVTGSASKAFARLVRDVSAVQPLKPKS